MITAYKVILLIIIVIGFLISLDKQSDAEYRTKSTAIAIAAMISFIITALWL